MTVYSAIKMIAKTRGVSIYRIERDLSFNTGLISKWNRSIPAAGKLQLVADYLGVTSAYILNKSKEEK